jgi:hypothetical protein
MQIYSKEWQEHTKNLIGIIDNGIIKMQFKQCKRYYCNNTDNSLIRQNYEDTKNNNLFCLPKNLYSNLTIPDRKDSANVIVYSLYWGDDIGCEKIEFYLLCILHSIKIINEYMYNFLVRFYICSNLVDEIKNNEKYTLMRVILNEIENYNNVELYKIKTTNPILLRVYRLLPMLDPCVNCCILKDADSIITIEEILNINKYVESNFALYINNCILNRIESNKHLFKYNEMYNHYKLPYDVLNPVINDITSHTHKQAEIILCGMIGSKVLLKIETFKEIMSMICEISIEMAFYDEIILNTIFAECVAMPKQMEYEDYIAINNIYKTPKITYKTKTKIKINKNIINVELMLIEVYQYQYSNNLINRLTTGDDNYLQDIIFRFSDGEGIYSGLFYNINRIDHYQFINMLLMKIFFGQEFK